MELQGRTPSSSRGSRVGGGRRPVAVHASSARAPTPSRAERRRSRRTSSASACSAFRKAKTMNFGFNEEQELLRSTARKFFDNECRSETVVRKLMDEPRGHDARALEEARRAGMARAHRARRARRHGPRARRPRRAHGGDGPRGGAGPFFSTVLLGGLAIREAGTDAQKKAWLPQDRLRRRRGPRWPGWSRPPSWARAGITLPAAVKGASLHAERAPSSSSTDAHTADVLVVAARTAAGKTPEEGVSLFLVPKGTPGLERHPPAHHGPDAQALRGRRFKDVRRRSPTRSWGRPARGWAPLARVIDRATVGAAAPRCAAARRRCSR